MKYAATTFAALMLFTALPASAQLVINPFPDQKNEQMPETVVEEPELLAPPPVEASPEPPAEMLAAPVDVPEEPRGVDLSNIHIPQPGDAYFDAPGVMPEEAYEEKFEAPEPLLAEPIEVSPPPMIVEEQIESPVVEDTPIAVRMSDNPYEGLSVEDVRKDVLPKPQRPFEDQLQTSYAGEDLSEPPEMPPMSDVSSEGDEAVIAEESDVVMASAEPASRQVVFKGRAWNALEGANIERVLTEWSNMEGVELIWNNENKFAVLESFDMETSYEQAVQSLLDQYKEDQVRPVARLHVSPESGQKTLVVEVLSGS